MAVKTAVELELLNAKYLRKLKQTQSKTQSSFSGMASAAKAFGAMVGGSIIARGFKAMMDATERQMQAEAQLEARLKSTGHAAGLSAEEIKKMAAALQQTTTYGDEAILEGQNLLLTFTKIGKDVFPQATETMLDMSTALGQDMKQSAIQLGKALNDPIQGVTALRRVGVQLSKEQEEQIRQFMAVNDVAGAQKVILGELANQMGGAAAAAAKTFGGAMTQLKNIIGDNAELIGIKMAPGLSIFARTLGDALKNGQGLHRTLESLGEIGSESFARLAVTVATVNVLLTRAATGWDRVFNKGGKGTALWAQNQADIAKAEGIMYKALNEWDQLLADQDNKQDLPKTTALINENTKALADNYKTTLENETLKTEAMAEQNQLRLDDFLNYSMSMVSMAQNLTSQMAAIEQQRTANHMQALSNRYTWARHFIEATTADEEEKQKKLERLNKIQELHKKILARREAQRMKQYRVAEATMGMFAGAVNAFQAMAGIPYVGPILGAIAAAAALALGATNIAMIQATPIPALAKGTPEIPTDTLMQAHKGEMVVPSSFADAIRRGDLSLGSGDGGSRVIQLVVDGRKLAEVVDDNRGRRASSMSASNYAYGSVYK